MNVTPLTRRALLGAAAGAALGGVPVPAAATAARDDFSFLLLGDLHFDRLEHHDMEWLRREKAGDIRQVENYSRITREGLPALMAALKGHTIADPRLAFWLHIGDFVEGLAGTPELARRHCREAVAYMDSVAPGRPFLFCKGNHDITGPGAIEAFDSVLLAYAAAQAGQELTSANYIVRRGDCLFAFYDAYARGGLEWLEKTLEKRSERRVFLVIHPPVVPYGARSNWHLFAKPGEKNERERLLNLLGRHRAIVLCGHLHKYGTVVRRTPEGPFVQVATVSVLPRADVKPKDIVSGVKEYGPDLVRLEPNFSPTTVEERRALLSAEAPFIRHYDYADAPGYGLVRVAGDRVTLDLYAGATRDRFRTLDLSGLLDS